VTKVALAFPTRFWPLGPASSMGLNNGPAFQVYDGGGSSSSDDASATTTNKKPAPGVLTFFALATGVDDDQELAQRCEYVNNKRCFSSRNRSIEIPICG